MSAFDPWEPYRNLRHAGTREHPDRGTCFIAEGRILVEDILAAGRAGRLQVLSVAATTGAAEAVRPLLPVGTELLTAEPAVLSELAGFPFHRGLLACAVVPPPPPEEDLFSVQRLLVLPRLHDTENFGLLLRSAAALGVGGVLAGPGPGQWTRRTVRVSMGAAWRLPVWRMAHPWVGLQAWKDKGPDSEIVAAALNPQAMPVHAWQPMRRCALVLGPEGPGLDESEVARCDRAVMIPMASGVDSLNVAAAGAILMFRMMASS